MAGALAGCGGSGGGADNAAIELTKRLPPGAAAYEAIDLAAYKDAQGLPEDADPMSTAGLATAGQPPFNVFYPVIKAKTGVMQRSEDISKDSFSSPPLTALDAIDPGSVTAAATSQESDRDREESVAVFATSADTGEIGSRLGDLGYKDVRGVLEAPGRGPSILLDDTVFYASDDADLLRALPDEPADDLPAALLGRLEGVDVIVSATRFGCIRESGVSVNGDGSSQIGFLIDGEASAERIEPADSTSDPRADGDVALADVAPEDAPEPSARAIRARLFPRYDCG
jgi:hypothetical protein